MKIRKAGKDEWEKLVKIDTDEGIKVIDDYSEYFKNIDQDRIIWFAEDKGRVIGSIQLLFYPLKEMEDKLTGTIFHLRIAKDYQRKGIGTLLQKTLEQQARNRGYKNLILSVNRKNKKAQEVYKHWGFQVMESSKDSKSIIMTKKIT